MTATPWRLSQKEGFDHLLNELVCGPDVPDLQNANFLCNAKVLIPSPEYRIQGGEIGSIGDYTERGIERANQENIMTAGILEFWTNHARSRQTIIYAVSVRHAENIVDVFRDAGIRTGIMLGGTHPVVRESTIAQFASGELRVLVNVAVATEGFDLPDASCVVIARPTQSLALYLQMLGRGLRPKLNGGDCLILDLAANSMLHGLPEDRRQWSLAPRGQPPEGEAPVVWCEHCDSVSPAASHNCQYCGAPFGEDCQRCGKWRSWSRWSLKSTCKYIHDIVCDRCHRDAHLQNHLPLTSQIEDAADMDDEDSSVSQDVIQTEDVEMTNNDNSLDQRLASLLRELLEEELHRVTSAIEYRRRGLQEFIKTRELALSDESDLDELFEKHLNTLPQDQKPKSNPQKYRMFNTWEGSLRAELVDKKNELANWADQPIDKNLIFERSKSRVLTVLSREANSANLLLRNDSARIYDSDLKSTAKTSLNSVIYKPSRLNSPNDGLEWISLAKLDSARQSPVYLKFPSGKEIPVESWDRFGAGIVNWLIERDILSYNDCPVSIGQSMMYFIHDNTSYFDTRRFHYIKLLDELYMNTSISEIQMVNHIKLLLEQYREDPAQYHVAVKNS